MPNDQTTDCDCLRCCKERRDAQRMDGVWAIGSVIRFGCEVCGNKRCPHHSDHRLACTGSNEPGQPGSLL